MKVCPNCRMVSPDDYVGSCPQCGRGLGDVGVGGEVRSLEARYRTQARGYGDENTKRVDPNWVSKERVAAVREILENQGLFPEEAA